MKDILNVGIIGFGLSGRFFFSPFIKSHPKFFLHSVVSSQNVLIKQIYPQTKIQASITDLLEDEQIDLIIVASPNLTHFDYTKQALLYGKHVIVEKPFTITSDQANELIQLSESQNCILAPFQNRRWDGDFLTIKKILSEGKLGEILEFESHFDRFRPTHDRVEWKNLAQAGNGVLFDLGPHLIDQALVLFGDPEYIYANICTQRINGLVDDNFEVQLFYDKLKVILKASVFVKENGPRFIIHGRKGSFVKYGLDPQENNLRNGLTPDDKMLGVDDEKHFGLLHTESEGEQIREIVDTIPGDYMQFFENVYNAIQGNESLIVKPNEAKMIIEVIEKAIQSSAQKRTLPF